MTNIENGAFSGCTGLTSITIPNSVTSIGNSPFSRCSSLASIKVESGNAYYDSRNDCNAIISKKDNILISGCKNTIIPNDITSIDGAFYGCIGLTSITIPNSVTNIGNNAFSDCSGLTSVIIPKSVTDIGSGAFSGCTGLISIDIPNSVTSIGSSAFLSCSGLTSIDIPNSVTSIGGSAFAYCSGLTSIDIPNSVTSIGGFAFAKCIGLKSIIIPNSITSIERETFWDCKSLTSITIPNSVTNIGFHAFMNCSSNLSSIKVEKGNAYYDSRDNCNAIISKKDNMLILGCKNSIVPNNVTSIGESAFVDCKGLTSLIIPTSVTTIGSAAFYGCKSLSSIKIPNSVTTIGPLAFSYCKSLFSITIPNSVTSIGSMAFYYCTNLKKATIEVNDDLTIADEIFSSSDLEELIINGETIPKYVNISFANGLYGITTLYVPSSIYEECRATSPWSRFSNIVEIFDEPIPIVNEPINLTDGKTFINVKEHDRQEISYTRVFDTTSWQSLYIPFSMSYDDWNNDFDIAYINGIHQYDINDDGAIDKTIMDVIKIKSGFLIPNTPYLIRAKTTGEKTFKVNNATLYKTEENSIDCRTTIAEYTFIGTYNTIPASTLIDNNYYAMDGGSLVITDGTSDLNPFRWYMKIDSRSPMYNLSNGAKIITINVIGEDEVTTGVEELQFANDKSFIYDLNGRKVSDSSLKPGIYIWNGKKTVVK